MCTPRHALPVTLALSVGLAACGGSTLSQDEYIKQADAICKEYTQKGKDIPRPEGLQDFGPLADRAQKVLEDEVEELRGLKAPDAVKDDADAAYDLLDQRVANLDDLKAAAEKADEQQLQDLASESGELSVAANAKARAIGLEVCGTDG